MLQMFPYLLHSKLMFISRQNIQGPSSNVGERGKQIRFQDDDDEEKEEEETQHSPVMSLGA